MVDLKQLRLVLFFTQGMSIRGWEESRLFEREVALYRAMLPHLGGITFVTYGDARDLTFSQRLDGIEIICNRHNLAPVWYRRYLAFWPGVWRRGAAVYKSNQVRGSDVALQLARRHKKPFIARCGYLLGDSMRWRRGPESDETSAAMELEKEVFGGADRVVVTTEHMKTIVATDYGCEAEKVRVIPNYVDTQLFAPSATEKAPRRLIFIGRLERQKNIDSLITALAGLNIELWIVGKGTWEERLRTMADDMQVQTRFFGVRRHTELPELLNLATAFILPSHWEGHPKTLLEAMSSGLPVIGGDIPSIRGVITHGENGLLCGLTPEEIRKSVTRLLDDPALQGRLGNNARRYALADLSIEKTVERELALLRELAV